MAIDVELDRLGPVEKLADGGQGAVFRLPRRPGQLLKRYHHGIPVCEARLRLLIDEPTRMVSADRRVVAATTAWPTCRVFDGSRCVGLLMTEAPRRFATTLAGQPRLLELQYLLYPRRAMWRELTLPTREERRVLVRQYLSLFHTLHRNHLIAGDVSMKNLLWTIEGGPGVFALDCDGYRVFGRRPAVRVMETAGWGDPAVGSGVTALDSDRYKLALLVLRVLLADHTITPESVAARPELRDELGSALSTLAELAVSPGARPPAGHWLRALSGLIHTGPIHL